MTRRNDFALVPPLQLPEADLSDSRNIRTRVRAFGVFQIRTRLACFEHKARFSFWVGSFPILLQPRKVSIGNVVGRYPGSDRRQRNLTAAHKLDNLEFRPGIDASCRPIP